MFEVVPVDSMYFTLREVKGRQMIELLAAGIKRAQRFDVAVGENHIMALTPHGELRTIRKSINVNVSITSPRKY